MTAEVRFDVFDDFVNRIRVLDFVKFEREGDKPLQHVGDPGA